MTSRDGARAARYAVPSGPNGKAFSMTVVGGPPTTVTGIEFEGASVRFRLSLANGADCQLDPAPARGYEGACATSSGDTLRLTLVPPVPGMLLPDHEVLLALDAATPSLRSNASVFVLGTSGYAKAVSGSNGYTCFIARPRAVDAWPMCQNRVAAEALLPAEQIRVRLRAKGLADSAITDSIYAAFRKNRLRAPSTGGMAYMMSRYAWTASAETGKPTFLGPHLHFYTPYSTSLDIGIDTAQRPVVPMRVEREGQADASVIVAVRLIPPPATHP